MHSSVPQIRTPTKIYLDYNAGVPMCEEVWQEWNSHLLELRAYGNPSSIHWHGRRARRLLDEARESIAKSLGTKVDPEQLIFTSSGSEANQLAIKALLTTAGTRDLGQSSHWILTQTEHDSVLQMKEMVQGLGAKVSVLGVSPQGEIDFDAVQKMRIPSEITVFSFLAANNETGVLNLPTTKQLSNLREQGFLIHIDAAQLWGKSELDISSNDSSVSLASSVSFSGHKIGGPAGTGVLWVNRGFPSNQSRSGTVLGKQEKGRRGGTENISGLLGLGAAARMVNPLEYQSKVRPLQKQFEEILTRRIPDMVINGSKASRIVNTTNVTFEGLNTDGLVMALDLAGFSVSSGSACSSGVNEPSAVLLAMGKKIGEARSSIRISSGVETCWEDLERFSESLIEIVSKFRLQISSGDLDG